MDLPTVTYDDSDVSSMLVGVVASYREILAITWEVSRPGKPQPSIRTLGKHNGLAAVSQLNIPTKTCGSGHS